MRFDTLVNNILMKGTVSQIFDIGPSFNFMSKNRKILIFLYSLFSTFD